MQKLEFYDKNSYYYGGISYYSNTNTDGYIEVYEANDSEHYLYGKLKTDGKFELCDSRTDGIVYHGTVKSGGKVEVYDTNNNYYHGTTREGKTDEWI
jgi:hypothetical protein